MKKILSIFLSVFVLWGLCASAMASGEASEDTGDPVVLSGDIAGYEDAAEFMTPKLNDAIAPDGLLDANRPVTRAEFCWMFTRMMGVNASDVPDFTDIPSDAYYRNAVGFLAHFAVVTGNEDGTFAPDEYITREEAFSIIANFFVAFENVTLVDAASGDYLADYTDAEDVSAEYADAVATMVLGEVAYSAADALRPGDKITVIEALDLLRRTNAAKENGSNFGEKDIPAAFKNAMTAVVYVDNGKVHAGSSEMDVVNEYGVTDTTAGELSIEVTEANRSAVLALGSATDFTVTDAELVSYADGDVKENTTNFSSDDYGVGAVVCAGAGAAITVRNSNLIQNGVGSNAAMATVNGTVALYDCYLETTDTGSRTLNTTNNSSMALYRCEVVAAGWGALSTDVSGGSVSVYAEDSSFTVKNGRYAAYSDGGCLLTLVNCSLNSNADGVVCTGTGSVDFTNVDIVASDTDGAENYSVRVTNVQSDAGEVAALDFDGGSIVNRSGPVFAVHSANANVTAVGTELSSGTGVLIEVCENIWMNYPVPETEDPPLNGVNFTFTDVSASGDILFSDPHHDMTLTLDGSTISGDIILGDTERTLTVYLRNGSAVTGDISEGVNVVSQ